jgi:hypothetical protein
MVDEKKTGEKERIRVSQYEHLMTKKSNVSTDSIKQGT